MDQNVALGLSWKKIDKNILISSFLSSTRKHSIYVKAWNICPEESDVTYILLHDFCEYHGRFNGLVRYLQSNASVNIVAIDYVGHGLSSGIRGHLDDFHCVVDDLRQLVDYLLIQNESQKIILVGHGMGGLVALDFQNKYGRRYKDKIKKMLLSNFLLKDSGSWLGRFGFKLNHFGFGKKLKMHKHYIPEAVTGKVSEQINYAEDPFIIHRPSLSTINLIMEKSNNIYQDSYFIDIPVFIAIGEGDQYIKKNGIEYFSKGIKKELVMQKTYSNMLHDLYNDNDSEVFFNDLLKWAK